MTESLQALQAQLEEQITHLGADFGYGPGEISLANLISVTLYLGWEYEDEELRESVTTVDSNLHIVRPPTPLNHKTLGGVLSYQLGYELAHSGLPAFPQVGTNDREKLDELLDSIGGTLDKMRQLSPDGRLKDDQLPSVIFTPRKRR